MVLPLLIAGGYGAAALASAAGAARLRRQLAKMAAGPPGDPLSGGVPLQRTEREVARLGRTLVISDELQVGKLTSNPPVACDVWVELPRCV